MAKNNRTNPFADMDDPMSTDETSPQEPRESMDTARAGRGTETRESVTSARGPSRAELIAKFRSEMFNNVLPETPDIPGYHLCWLSTTNAYDAISHRETLGYERVKPEDLPGMEHITLTQGHFSGCIGLNEMVLYKLPIDLWHEFMNIAHHERPFGEEDKIREAVRYVQEQARDGGGDVYLGNGTNEILNARNRRAPTFSE